VWLSPWHCLTLLWYAEGHWATVLPSHTCTYYVVANARTSYVLFVVSKGPAVRSIICHRCPPEHGDIILFKPFSGGLPDAWSNWTNVARKDDIIAIYNQFIYNFCELPHIMTIQHPVMLFVWSRQPNLAFNHIDPRCRRVPYWPQTHTTNSYPCPFLCFQPLPNLTVSDVVSSSGKRAIPRDLTHTFQYSLFMAIFSYFS